MSVTVRSFAKINLGLCIGALRRDGFHDLRTIYQTIALHDVIRVEVTRGAGIEICCQDPRVPKDQSNTCYRIVEPAMEALRAKGRVVIDIDRTRLRYCWLWSACSRETLLTAKNGASRPMSDQTCRFF